MDYLKLLPKQLIFTACIGICLLTGCASPGINETAYPYFLNEDLMAERAPRKIIVTNENFGSPSKKYLREYENQIDQVVIDKLKAAGYAVESRQPFEAAWRRAVRKYGSPYDPYSLQINTMAFRRVIATVLNELKETTDVDALVFTDLLEQQIVFRSGNQRVAKWHGVSRKPRYTAGNTLSESFNWAEPVPAASLRVIIYTLEGELLFRSFGGLEVTRELNARKERFVRRDKLFSRSENVDQGVRAALQPLVPAK